jgi:hypothetical protein
MTKNFDKLAEELRGKVFKMMGLGYDQIVIEVSEELFRYLWDYLNAIAGDEMGDIKYQKGYFMGIPIIVENVETFKILVETRDE